MTATSHEFSLLDKFTVEQGQIYLTGVQALVRLPMTQRRIDLAQGLNTATFISGYPGSPLGGYDLELQRRRKLLEEHHIVHQMGVNEELGATAVMGSQLVQQLPQPKYDGVVGLWYGKANGLDRAMDALRQANLIGTTRTGGAVALVGDDPTAKSSPTPGASEFALASMLMPILYPGDVQEVLDLGLHAIGMSRSSGLWTALKMSTTVADGSGAALVSPDRVVPTLVTPMLNGNPYQHVPSSHMYGDKVLAMEHSQVNTRMWAALEYARVNDVNRITLRGEADKLGLIASGKTYFELRQALSALGLDDDELNRLGVRLLQLRMPYPLEGEIVREFSRGLTEILILEDKRPFVQLFVKDELYPVPDRPLVVGKTDENGETLLPMTAELDQAALCTAVVKRLSRFHDLAEAAPHVLERLERLTKPRTLAPLPLARSPYFCSGCPHNTSVTGVDEDTIVAAGTGCHVLAVFMRPADVGKILGITAMGGEGAQWIGAAPFTEVSHLIQNIGDGTFAHSGSLAIRATVAAGVNITYKLLYNDHVAMTGAQPAIGIAGVPDVVRSLLAEGVSKVIVTTEELSRYRGVDMPAGVDVWDRSRLDEAMEILTAVEGVTVLLHDQECATEKRRRRKRGTLETPATKVFINEMVCEGCGDCGVKSNCLSVHPVQTPFGRKTQIHQPSCNVDYSCLQGNCPSFLTVVPGEQRRTRTSAPELSADALPRPQVRVDTDDFGMRITGIGGTGVVTVAQTLAVAALLEGKYLRGLDQTGLAQKGGPVISDLRITASEREMANKLTGSDADLYLACDALVGSQQANLSVADPRRTIAVTSLAEVPTGHMVVNTEAAYPEQAMLLSRIDAATRSEHNVSLDASGVAEHLFGTDQVANILLVGAAYQAGALPLSAESIEKALELNGVAVEMNLQAFRRGRQAVADRKEFEAVVARLTGPTPAERAATATLSHDEERIIASVHAQPGSELATLVRLRVPQLVAYQSAEYADRYARRVEAVRAAEERLGLGRTELSEAVAFSLYKFMAYKDEYEVARLHLDPLFTDDLASQFGDDAAYSFKLHPPVLKAIGMENKISIPASVGRTMFRALAPMKRLRGTRLDPFGYDHVRVVERKLLAEFESFVDDIPRDLTPENYDTLVQIAELPDIVRGYDEVKLVNVERYHAELATLRAGLSGRRAPAESEMSR